MLSAVRQNLPRLIRLNARYLPYFITDRMQDAWYGIRTATGFKGYLGLDDEAPVGDRTSANPYVPTPFGTLRRLFAALPSNLSRYAFVDFGSGRGRTLVMAGQRGFREVVGVEFAKRLHEQAVRNLAAAGVADRARSVLCDARDFVLPDGPCVAFFFNPFGAPVMEQVAGNIALAFAAKPRHIIVALYNETVWRAFDRHPAFRPTATIREGWLDGLSHNRRYVVRLLETDPGRLGEAPAEFGRRPGPAPEG